jgi:hypothetical protein
MRLRLSNGVVRLTGMQGPRFGGLIWLMVQHHFTSIYAEAVFLFAVNGLIITQESALWNAE